MPNSLQSLTFKTVQQSLDQVFDQLKDNSAATKTPWFSILRSQTQTEWQITELPQRQIDKATPQIVMFSQLSWATINELANTLAAESINCVAIQLIKPSQNLTVAAKIELSHVLSEQQKLSLLEWADQQDIELCYIHESIPTIAVPGLLVMDMDSTAIQIECIDEIAKLAGVGEQVAKVTEAAMRGELDFAESLRARVATLKDAPVSIIDQVADNLPLMPGLEELVSALKDANWKVVVASGGFTYMTEVLKQQLGLDKTVANQLEMHDGKLTGQVLGDIVDANVKAQTVEELAKQWQIPMNQTVAIGDGANDLVMMAKAQLGVAFHAKPIVRQKADTCIKQGSLEQLLYLIV